MALQSISTAQKKLATQLDMAKYRRRLGLFKAEGSKCVLDTINYFRCTLLAATESWLESHSRNLPAVPMPVVTAKKEDMAKMSHMSTAPEVIAIYEIPDDEFDATRIGDGLTIALDGVQDPGNLGTIIRLADWFGIEQILCSENTVDIYNPKAVMATMGAISRVKLHYCNLSEMLSALNDSIPIMGTFLKGENIFHDKLPNDGVVVFGNEGNGISEDLKTIINRKITIPSYPPGRVTSESLNVAMAAAIILSQLRQKIM